MLPAEPVEGFIDLQVQAAGLVGGMGGGALPSRQQGPGQCWRAASSTGCQGPHGIGHDPVGRPVAAADYVAGADGIVAALPQGALAIHRIGGHAGQGVGSSCQANRDSIPSSVRRASR